VRRNACTLAPEIEGEEVFEVHFQDDSPAGVRSDERFYGVSFEKAVNGGVRWDFL
jgi:hypothetical protein